MYTIDYYSRRMSTQASVQAVARDQLFEYSNSQPAINM